MTERYTPTMAGKRKHRSADDERVSLAPLDPEEALRALLQVDPESEPIGDRPTEDDAADEGDRG